MSSPSGTFPCTDATPEASVQAKSAATDSPCSKVAPSTGVSIVIAGPSSSWSSPAAKELKVVVSPPSQASSQGTEAVGLQRQRSSTSLKANGAPCPIRKSVDYQSPSAS